MANALGMSAIGVGTACIRMRIRVDLGTLSPVDVAHEIADNSDSCYSPHIAQNYTILN